MTKHDDDDAIHIANLFDGNRAWVDRSHREDPNFFEKMSQAQK